MAKMPVKPPTEVIDATARAQIAALTLRVQSLEADVEHLKSIVAAMAGQNAPVDWAKNYLTAE